MQRTLLTSCSLARPLLVTWQDSVLFLSANVLSRFWPGQDGLDSNHAGSFACICSQRSHSIKSKAPTSSHEQQQRVQPDKQRVNSQIQHQTLRVVFPEGHNQIMPRAAALKAASDLQLDLVEVSANSNPPVARLCNLRKERHEKKKRLEEAEKLARQKSRLETPKELKFSTVIADHDLEIRLRKARELLQHGRRLQLTVEFKSSTEKDAGSSALEYILARLSEDGELLPQSRKVLPQSVTAILKPLEQPSNKPSSKIEPPKG